MMPPLSLLRFLSEHQLLHHGSCETWMMDLKFSYDAQLESCLVRLNRSMLVGQEPLDFDMGTGKLRWRDLESFSAMFGRASLGVETPHRLLPLPAGRMHLLLGRNGAGKSLLLNSLKPQGSVSLLSSSLIVSLPSDISNSEWAQRVDELRTTLEALEEPYIAHELFEQAARPIVSALEKALVGDNPIEYLGALEMSAEDVLTFFNCTSEEIQRWKDRLGDIEGTTYGSIGGIGDQRLWGLDSMIGEFLLSGARTLPHNSAGNEFEPRWVYEGSVLSSAPWLNDSQRRDLVVPGVRQFLSSITHAEITDRGGRLLAPLPESGALREILELQRIDLENRQSDPNLRLPFPVGLFQPFSLGGRPYVASFEIEVSSGQLFELIDVSPASDTGALDVAFERLAMGLVAVTATSDDELGVKVSGVSRLKAWLDAVSKRLSQCEIGVEAVRLKWPPTTGDLLGHRVTEEGEEWSYAVGAPRTYLPTLEWRDAVSGEWLNIDSASLGQREVMVLFLHLARLAFERRGHALKARQVILLSDEFDSSLHPTASTAVLEQVAEITHRLPGVSVIMTTHNVAALGRPSLRGVSCIFAERSLDDFRYVESLDSSVEVMASVLGSSFLDVLKTKRLHILVEGNHDELVISDALRDQIPEIRDVELVNGRGLYAWSGIIANSLRFLDAPILLVHDKRDEQLEDQWKRIQDSFIRTGRLPNWGDTGLSAMLSNLKVRKHKGRSEKSDGELERLLWLLKNNVFDRDHSQALRIHIFGLDCDDIVDLLPISSFPKANGFRDWTSAHSDFDKRHPRAGGEKFKLELDIHDRSVQAAVARNKDAVHPELGRLVDAVRSLLDGGTLPQKA
jgi:hypothetical protein